jgi:protein-S-isoprenylcysteine O-methyltransferase Ste14
VSPPYWWQVRLLLIVAVASGLPLVVHLATHPALLLRRLRSGPLAEREASQKVIALFLQFGIFALCALSALDHDHGWSHVPLPFVLLGDLLVASGLLLIWLVFRANPFAAATITVESIQPVISTGPYALVRHPMYSGLLLIFLGIPPALGSWWGLVFVPPLLGILIWRLADEERYLAKHLSGYQDYHDRVPHRLVPRIW